MSKFFEFTDFIISDNDFVINYVAGKSTFPHTSEKLLLEEKVINRFKLFNFTPIPIICIVSERV